VKTQHSLSYGLVVNSQQHRSTFETIWCKLSTVTVHRCPQAHSTTLCFPASVCLTIN